MNVLTALNWRYAVRKFSDQELDEAQVQQLLTATRLSASSYGLQPYRLIVVKSAQLRQQLIDHSYGQGKVANCSHLIVFATQTNIGDETVNAYTTNMSNIEGVSLASLQNMSDHFKSALAVKTAPQKRQWAEQQAYIALGNLLTSAAMMKIDSCPMGGIDPTGYDQVLGLAARGLTTTVVCPIGIRHPDDTSANKNKVRVAHDEMIIRL